MNADAISIPRWWAWHLFTRNPLVRAADRIEGAVILLAVTASLAAAAVACALATAVHDTQAQKYAEQSLTRHTLAAIAVDDSENIRTYGSTRIAVRARWQTTGTQRVDTVTVGHPVKAGEVVQVWVDGEGNQVDRPKPVVDAVIDAVVVALASWSAAALAMAGLVTVVHAWAQRVRDAQWEREFRCLADHDDGDRHP